MDSLADEFSSYVDIGSVASGAPCGLICSSSKKHSSDQTDDQQSNSKKHNFIYRNKTSKFQELPCYLNNNSVSPLNKIKSKTKNRYSTRSSSILLKSNSLALSDSESTETISNDESKMNSFFSDRKQKVKKPRRKRTEKDNNQSVYSLIPINNNDQYYGKRKRSTTITQNTYEQTNNTPMSIYTTNRLKKNEFDSDLTMQYDYNDKTSKLTKYAQSNDNKMEVENDESSSSLSEESNLSDDPRFADDEQSDWYDSQSQKKNRRQYGRTSLEKTSSFGIVNPFSMLSSTPPSSLNNFWKKRRKNVSNNHF